MTVWRFLIQWQDWPLNMVPVNKDLSDMEQRYPLVSAWAQATFHEQGNVMDIIWRRSMVAEIQVLVNCGY